MLRKSFSKAFPAKQKGYVSAYYAVFILVVCVPLMSLCIDVVRGLYVHAHLSAAADAACTAAAQALDVPAYQVAGIKRINLGTASSWAGREFNSTVRDENIVEYSPAITGVGLRDPLTVEISAAASLHLIIPATPPLNITVDSICQARWD